MILDNIRDTKKKISLSPARKTWITKCFFFLIFLLILTRSLELQIFKTNELDKMAISQYQRFKKLQTQRGSIYDSKGQLLSSSIPYYSAFILIKQLEDKQNTIEELSRVLPQTAEEIYRKIYSGKKFVWLEKLFHFEQKKIIEDLKLAGVHVVQDFQRYYPLENLASHVLGFVGYGSQGLEGLEYRFNNHLLDVKGDTNSEKIKGKVFEGGKIFLTIDENIQYFAEKALKNQVEKLQAVRGQVIVMESKTASILAMANYPNYNPNHFADYSVYNYFNQSVNAVYEPGSTFKIITLAAALEEKLITPQQKIYCEEGSFFIGGSIIRDVKPYAHLKLHEVLQKSSNICALKIGRLIKNKKFYQYIRDFGFGEKTNIELPGEIRGAVHNYKKWSNLDKAVISYGHSISVTPIQLISAINTIANNGMYISPTIIRQTQNALNNSVKLPKQKKKRVVSKNTAQILREMMVSVTQKGGTGYLANIPNIEIAAKTGTARKYDKEQKQYSTESHILSFVGFFPAKNPQLTILVILDDPKEKGLNRSAAPLFKQVAKAAIRHYEIENTKRIWRIEKKAIKKKTIVQEQPALEAVSYSKN